MEDKFELNKILVSLDLSEMDERLVRFSCYTARMMNSKRVYFMHISPDLEVPQAVREKWGDKLSPVDEQILANLKQLVSDTFDPLPDCETFIEVHEGNPIDKLLKLSHKKDVDLLVLGNKDHPQAGAIGEKVLKASHRSVLLVPDQLPRKMDRVLVPTDFSEHSLRALRQAIKIRENSEYPLEIKCQHVYQLPSGWHTTGKSEKEFAAIMQQHAEDGYKKFLAKLPAEDRDIPCVFTLDNNNDPVREIYAQAVREQSDMILIGSKGKSAAAAVLMGSVAERLAHHNKSIPMLIVKDKNENIGFLQALFKI